MSLNPLFRRSPGSTRTAGGKPGATGLLVLGVCFYGASFFGIRLGGRQFWPRLAGTVTVIALCWLSLRLLDVSAKLSLKRLEQGPSVGRQALVLLINRLSKAATVIVAGLVLLYLANVDLTAALTGLGVGGLAIGFGAQKTIENLFGRHHGDFGQASERGGYV